MSDSDATAEKAKTAPTEYVVLREETVNLSVGATTASNAESKVWREVARSTGPAANAIKKAAKEKTGRYLAIPARSFKPVTLTTKTETKVTLS
jgi:hypothetical protein